MLPVGRLQRACSSGHLPGDHSLIVIWTSQGSHGVPCKPSGEAVSCVWAASAASSSAGNTSLGIAPPGYTCMVKSWGAMATQQPHPLVSKSKASKVSLLLLSLNSFTFCRRPTTTQGANISRDILWKKLSLRFISWSIAPRSQVTGNQSVRIRTSSLSGLMQKSWRFLRYLHLCIQTLSPIMGPGTSLRNIIGPEITMLWAVVILSPQGLAQTWQTLEIQIHYLISLEPKVNSLYLKILRVSSALSAWETRQSVGTPQLHPDTPSTRWSCPDG